MLFVFQVDTGRMMTFDMSLALETVHNLKSHVERACDIPVEKQVLLISGGENLQPDARVCSYPAGTDTNPIFLFSKAVIESDQPPAASSVDFGSEHDLPGKTRESHEWPATANTVNKRCLLAKMFHEVGQGQLRTCEKLVHEQHLQQQGWSAVVANLEDLNADLKVRWKYYQEAFQEYIAKRDLYVDFLNQFKNNLLILQKIPVLPALIESQKSIVPESHSFSKDNQTESIKDDMTLFDWICQREDFMDCLFEICTKSLQQTDEKVFHLLQDEVEKTLTMTEDSTMKEIKGLGDRLFGLEKLMQEARQCVNDQARLYEAIQRNSTKPSLLCKDTLVLQDLCSTHIKQISVLLDNHNRLRDILRRCVRAKDELSSNLYHRLKWIVFMEDNLSELDNKLVFYYQNLLSLQQHLDVLQQVHTAPAMYLSTVVEVVRRRKISQSFLLWASDVACHLLTIYNEELARRKDFQSQIEGHFLSSLFPGMEDLPPAFATQAPSIFDSSLPKLSDEDVEMLKQEVPELAENLQVPDTSSVTNYFMLRDSKDELDKNPEQAVEEKLMEVVTQAGLASNLDQNLLKTIEGESSQVNPHGLPHLKDLDRGCESETDTEEFEKVGQSPFDLHFDKTLPSPRPGTQDASTLTEDNLQISRSQYEKLQTVLGRLSELSRDVHGQFRSELLEIKNRILTEKVNLEETCSNINSAVNNILIETENGSRRQIQQITVDHELEISDFRKIAQGKNEEIKSLKDSQVSLNTELQRVLDENKVLKEQVEELRKRMNAGEVEKEKAIKETTDRLKGEHRAELESIRARFKLMTMERSPSENSLEKIERGEYSSITNPEALLLQVTENFESEKEVAVSDAVNKESQRWQKILEDRVKEIEKEFAQEREYLVEVPKDKDAQIEKLQEELNNLNMECLRYKDVIQQLNECKDDSEKDDTLERIEVLERDRAALELEVERYKEAQKSKMVVSVAVCEGVSTSDMATSPIKSRKRSEISCSRGAKLSIDSCKAGDLVLVMWDATYQNYKILQESSYMFFLNADCMEALGLNVTEGIPNKHHCYAEVVEKEYCHARKPVNRFRVPQGTKFFRVKVRPPLPAKNETPLPHHGMSQSQRVAAADPVVTEATPSRSLPSSPTRWEKSAEGPILEEIGEDSGGRSDEGVERGTELTENYVEAQSTIDREISS